MDRRDFMKAVMTLVGSTLLLKRYVLPIAEADSTPAEQGEGTQVAIGNNPCLGWALIGGAHFPILDMWWVLNGGFLDNADHDVVITTNTRVSGLSDGQRVKLVTGYSDIAYFNCDCTFVSQKCIADSVYDIRLRVLKTRHYLPG